MDDIAAWFAPMADGRYPQSYLTAEQVASVYAEITTLRAKLAQAEAEAARVVDWLRAGVSHRPDIDADIADLIERGAHKEPTP